MEDRVEGLLEADGASEGGEEVEKEVYIKRGVLEEEVGPEEEGGGYERGGDGLDF